MAHDHPGDGCYGCWDTLGYRTTHETYFTDSRTGRKFCHECVAALVTWELDECPEPEELCYPGWINDDDSVTKEEAPC